MIIEKNNELFTVVVDKVVGEWRWGPELELIIKDIAGNFWRTYWRRQTDWEWSIFDDEETIDFERVVPKEKVVVEYVRP